MNVLDSDLVRPPMGSVMVAQPMFVLKSPYYILEAEPKRTEWVDAMHCWEGWDEEVGPWSWLRAPVLVDA